MDASVSHFATASSIISRIGFLVCAFGISFSICTVGQTAPPAPPADLVDEIASPSDQPPPLPEHPERGPRDPEKTKPKPAKPNRPAPPLKSGPLLIEKRLPMPGKPDRNLAPLHEKEPGDDAEGEGEASTDAEVPEGIIRRLPHNIRDGGITAAYIYTGESFYLARGGSSNRRVGNYRHNLDVVVNLDTQKMGWWDNGRFFIYGESLQGRPLSKEFVGDVQLFSNIDSTINATERPYFATIASYYYEQLYADEKLRTKIGKIDANIDFALSDLGGDFVNSSFGLNPNIPLPTFPSQALGVSAFFNITEKATIGGGVYDGTLPSGPSGTQFGFNTLGHCGAISLLQLEYKSQTGPGGEHPGTIRVGGWQHSDPNVWTDFTGAGDTTFNQNYGMWCNVDQMLWKESYGTDSDQGFGVFFMCGLAPPDRNVISESYGYGLSYKGLLEGRDDDVFGAAVATAVFSDDYRTFTFNTSGATVSHSETAIELFYKYRYSKYCVLQPDMQFIANPGGQYRDALLPGLRFQLMF